MQGLFPHSRIQLNKTGFTLAVVSLVLFSIWLLHAVPSDTHAGVKSPTLITIPKAHWPGWGGINHLVVFGDSYTATGFQTHGAQPSRANPLGNPEWPGHTSANGPNWVDFLTTTYNRTFVKTVNFAYGGATVDKELIKQMVPMIHSFKDQVKNEFLPNYARPPQGFQWKAEDTLFATFFGINDVNNAYKDSIHEWALAEDVKRYACLVDEVYQAGARNFLFMTVPPFDRSPLLLGQGVKAVQDEKVLIEQFNANLTRMAANFSRSYDDVTTFVFDTHRIYTQVLDAPCAHKESCAIKNVDEVCREYVEGTPDWYTKHAGCQVAVDEYFWLSPLHPGFRIHNVTAKAVAAELSRGGTGVSESRPSALPMESAHPY